MRIGIEQTGAQSEARRMFRIADRAANLTPAWEVILKAILAGERARFETGAGWAPLKPATVAQKQAEGMDNGILRRTQALMRSLTERGAAGQRLEVTPRSLLFGTDLKRAAYHQSGTARMPARPPLELNEGERRAAMKVIQRYLITGTAG